MSLGFVVKGIMPQYHISNRTKQDINEGILTFKVPMFKDLISENLWNPINQNGPWNRAGDYEIG